MIVREYNISLMIVTVKELYVLINYDRFIIRTYLRVQDLVKKKLRVQDLNLDSNKVFLG